MPTPLSETTSVERCGCSPISMHTAGSAWAAVAWSALSTRLRTTCLICAGSMRTQTGAAGRFVRTTQSGLANLELQHRQRFLHDGPQIDGLRRRGTWFRELQELPDDVSGLGHALRDQPA